MDQPFLFLFLKKTGMDWHIFIKIWSSVYKVDN